MSNPYNVPELSAGCPWADWSRPNIKWCEENLCAWVTAPANTWSNLAYIVLGLWMWRMARKSGKKAMLLFGPASIVVGVTSLLYHASYTFVFQFGDFVGMFVFIDLLVSFNQRRLGQVSGDNHARVYLLEVIVSSLLVPICFYAGIPIQLLVLASILWVLGLEAMIRMRGEPGVAYKWLFCSVGAAAAGATCSALDVTGVWCDPHDHVVQGHAAWHVLTALALLFAYYFYEQFAFEGDGAA